MDSPPKRITRSRAAKATEPAGKSTKIVTAAARAKSTATASTRSTAAKRKTRADEDEGEEDERDVPARKMRGRPRKTEKPDIEVPVTRSARTRTAKEVTMKKSAEASAAPPAKPGRGRPRKVVVEAPAGEAAPEPAKKTTRTRTAATIKTAATTKPAVKKTVKFQEPDKENIEPAAKPKDKEPATVGLRGRPARRGATTTTRTAKATTKSAEHTKKKPLSPKKVTQVSMSKDESEDELAGDTTPVKPMMKSPIKPPSSVISSTKQNHTDPLDEPVEPTIMVNMALNAPDLGISAIASPAKRPPASPFKDAMKSPAKRVGLGPLPGSALKPASQSNTETEGASPFKPSLLQSAAKRPQSPIKGPNFGSTSKPLHTQSAVKASLLQSPAKRSFPGMVPLTEPRRHLASLSENPFMEPITMATPTPAQTTRPSDRLMMEDASTEDCEELADDVFDQAIEDLEFNGRLSALLPRSADPAWQKGMEVAEEPQEEAVQLIEEVSINIPVFEEAHEDQVEGVFEQVGDEEQCMAQQENMLPDVDSEVDETPEEPEESLTPKQSPVHQENTMYQLRDKDLDPCHDMDSETEDEDASGPLAKAETSTPAVFSSKTPKTQGTGRSAAKPRVSLSGFTPLAERFGSWETASPIKMALPSPAQPVQEEKPVLQKEVATPSAGQSPVVNNFFDDEMSVRSETQPEKEAESSLEKIEEEVEDPSFNDMMVTQEDVALADEANEMSLMEPEQMEDVINTSFEDTLSEASQEYGDENEMPIDPAMMGPVTPARPMANKPFHTTTKVPLKPADDSTPSPIKKRSFSASRVGPKRPGGPTGNATVISYSPMKERKSLPASRPESPCSAPATPEPVTPSKADLWSAIGTPARTPRRDLDSDMLRGAVVFVDVHTSEGADASGIFMELLTQMGAKCLKSWSWQPHHEGNEAAKIGITHVVYKDGGKRTLEKVRETKGVVQCVGVSWVLDCERENEWLDEAPYYVDTSLVPRGGARRRKSMEPKALANLNGTLTSSPVKGSSRENQSQTAPNTPLNRRRESTAWMHTPSDQGEDEDMEDDEWSNALLTPVPKTPAPDAIARYAAALVPETPMADDEDDEDDDDAIDDEDESPTKQPLLTRTCPPKKAYREMSQGILGQPKDEHVLLRLMAARRKSMQFAPKTSSPLARAWK